MRVGGRRSTGSGGAWERIEGMAALPSHPLEPVIDVEPFASLAVQEVVARAEDELIARYGSLDLCESNLTEVQFGPPSGAFLVGRLGRRGRTAGRRGRPALRRLRDR